MEGNALGLPGDAFEADLVARATRIVLDATEVDWSRDPATEYEAEIRRTWLSQQMGRGPFGRIEIVDLAFGMDEMGTDLREAFDGIVMIAEVRAVRRQRGSLRSARDEVNGLQPRI
ncbi:MAG TPA: hypothetical protein VGC72_14610 [Candidatus Elarobacter sp.]|jgi:hypothetical protein